VWHRDRGTVYWKVTVPEDAAAAAAAEPASSCRASPLLAVVLRALPKDLPDKSFSAILIRSLRADAIAAL
jgi:hypothetical protein